MNSSIRHTLLSRTFSRWPNMPIVKMQGQNTVFLQRKYSAVVSSALMVALCGISISMFCSQKLETPCSAVSKTNFLRKS